MLIHLEGVVDKNVCLFELPQIYFKRGQMVAVTEVNLEYAHKIHDLMGYISSSLVDKSPANPKQQIFNIHQSWGSSYSQFIPQHLAYYKIQCLDLNSTTFKLHVWGRDKNGKPTSQRTLVKHIYLTLQISE